MNDIQIKIILSVARHLNFSAAAAETSFSVSTISKQVSALEEELKIRIFDRCGRSKVTITKAGEIILPYLQQISEDIADLNTCATSVSSEKQSQLYIASPASFSSLGEDRLIADFCCIHSEIDVNQIFGNRKLRLKMLENREVDVIFNLTPSDKLNNSYKNFSDMMSNNNNIQTFVIEKNNMILAIKKNHPAIHDGHVDLKDLSEETFLFRQHSHFEEKIKDEMLIYFERACLDEGFYPQIRCFPNLGISTIFNIVSNGYGIAPLMHIPSFNFPGVKFLPLTKNYYSTITTLSFLKNNDSLVLKSFIDFVKNEVKPLKR